MGAIRQLVVKLVGKAAKTDATDAFTQMNVDDTVHVIKVILSKVIL